MKKHSPWMVLVTVALGTLIVGLDRTVVNLALPAMIRDFHISIHAAGWIATIYLLTNAICIPIFGKLSDMYGARRVYMWSFIAFIVVSVATAFSWNLVSMLVFRGIQGIAGAAVYPTAMALIAKSFVEKEKRAEALGAWTSIIAGSIVIGPLVGGPLVDHFSWPSVFFINLPIGIIGLILALMYLPENEPGEKQKFDLIGTGLLGVSLSSLLLVLEQGSTWGWSSLPELLLIAATIIFGILFYIRQKSITYALIPLHVFKNNVLKAILSVSLVSYGALFGFMFIVSLFVQDILHFSATYNGYVLLPLLITLSIVSPIGGKLLKRFKPHIPIIGGLILSSLGIAILFAEGNSITFISMIIPLALVGAGLGLTSAPLSTTVTTALPHSEVGLASGLLNLSRNLAGVFGITFCTVLLSLHVSYMALFGIGAIVTLLTCIPALALKRASI